MKISLSNLFNYFSVSGDSKQIKNSHKKSCTLTTTGEGGGGGHFVVGTTQKYHYFYAAPYALIIMNGSKDFIRNWPIHIISYPITISMYPKLKGKYLHADERTYMLNMNTYV